jgi:succinate dehydrogenase/fumarate reductase flavoprotein subunit
MAAVAATATVGSNAGRALANEAADANAAWDEEYDAIVVGAGLAGASAAATLAVEGGDALKVLLIEKSDNPLGGGNSHYSGGSVIMTDAEHKAGALNYWKELRGACTSTPDDVLEAFVDHMATTEDFLDELGCDPADYTLFAPGQAYFLDDKSSDAAYSSGSIISCWPEYPEFEDSVSVGRLIFSGKEMTTWSVFMEHVVEEHSDSITFKTSAALTGLVQDAETRGVVGIVYDDNGTVKRAKAGKGVVLALGGFERNPEMLENYLGITHAYHIAGDCDTGDGYRLCDDLGAAFWHMNSMAGTWNGAISVDGTTHAPWFTTGRQYGITVGINGRRYYMDVDYVVSQNWYDYQKGDASLATTASCRHGHYNFGGEWPHMILPAKSWFIFDADNLENAVRGGVMKLTDGDPVEDGWAVRADTIEELAEKIEVPANELTTTVDTWNESCEKGVDVQFYRAPDWLTPVKTAPFYAIPMEPEFINTDGGPVRDAQARIIDRDGDPIPGLYSAGEFGSVWCNMYQGGGNLSECVQFGRIAAESIIKGA